MAESVVSFASQHVLPKFLEAVKKLRDLPKEVAEVTDELESFQDFIRDANKVFEAEEDNNRRDRIRKRLMRLREAAFRMEDVIDDYVICDEKQPEEDPRCAALLGEAIEFIKTQILRLQIAYQIQDAKSLVRAERDGFQNHFPIEPRLDSSRGNENFTWHKLRMDPLFIKQDVVVGLEGPIQTLKRWLTEGREERTVISIVGMAGLGKTTLSKQVFDKVHRDFECHVLITVSRSYNVEELLRDMTNKLCKERMEDPPRDVATMNQLSLIEEIRNRLHHKRYVVLFDDVWNETFWDDIELALIDNKNGSRILITTRDERVVEFCRKALFFEVHKLQPLSKEKSVELLCKKAFGYDFHGRCPEDYEEVGLDIVRKCECLPLAIVAIGSLLYRKCKTPYEWRLFSQNLSSELQGNSELHSVTKILSLSYDALPQNLRSCLLYFGLYPEDYEVKCGRLIRQWIAEGFVKHESGKNIEEVAQQYLMELISRSLVQVSSFTSDDRAKACRVHDSMHEMIREKMKNTGFCEYIDENNHLEPSGTIRCLAIATSSNCLSGSIEGSHHVRSIIIFGRREVLSEEFTNRLLAKYRRLKVLDFGYAPLYDVPENLGSLIHLKYLSFRSTFIRSLPKSIGKLQNLETLDVGANREIEVPKEITKLRKLRCLLGNRMSAIAVKDSIGSMTSLQMMHILIDRDGVVIRELGKLKQLRDMRLSNVMGNHSDTLSSSINQMQLLERLDIFVQHLSEPIDLQITSSLSKLRKLHLYANLKEFPSWIPRLQNLVKLSLVQSRLTIIPLMSLGNMPNLLFLSFGSTSYEGDTLHFENGGFQKLKELELQRLQQLRSIFIDSGVLQSLEKLQIMNIPQLKAVPSGIQHLKKLQVLDILYMSTEFLQRIDPNGGEDYFMIKHVPHLHVVLKNRAFLLAERAANILCDDIELQLLAIYTVQEHKVLQLPLPQSKRESSTKMAETAVSFASQHVLPRLLEVIKMFKDLPKEVAEVTDELESFQEFIHDANKVAEAEEDNNRRDRIRKRLMRLREAAFRMEDVIDDYLICDNKQPEEDPRCAALLCETVEIIKTQILRLQIAYRIQDVKSLVRAEKDGFENHFPLGHRSESSRGNENSTWQKLRMDPLFIKEDEVVGFEGPIHTLKKWLTEGRKERIVISVVGMAGLGKTTLSKQVFDRVHTDFECHALITVSRSYTVEGLLRDLTNKLCKERMEDPHRDVATMNQMSLIEEVRTRLQNKRYVVLFDDIWNETFWDDIELALIDNKNGSRILITTRSEKVVEFCKKALCFEVHKLQPLSKEKSLELLCKKAFGYGFDGCCPKDYEEVGLDIVRKCGCLPLAIVAIGSLLYRKCKSPSDWGMFSKNVQSNSELDSVKKILSLSYDDLPQNLKSCLLYFGMYPEDYEVKCGRLIQQWIAEGFVKHESGRKLEEVAQQHLMELVSRSLVLVSSFTKDDKARACRVHDSIHEMIRGKMKNSGFCHFIDEDNHMVSSGIIRRLTIASSIDLTGTIEGSQNVRSVLIFTREVLSEDFTSRLLAKYMRLKVLDFEFTSLYNVPENLGSLIHLKYLSFRNTYIRSLPESIGKLQNLETLDVRSIREIEVPKEITKLRKLRCLFGNAMSSITVKDSLGKLTSLEKMRVLMIDPDGVVIRELGKLKQLRELKLVNLREDHSDTLCSAINEMQLLERLHISVRYGTEAIDLHIRSSLSKLKKLHLYGNLKEFPSWIPQLQNLVKLSLRESKLINIPLISLGNMPNLLLLSFDCCYEGETLRFENGGFQKLKELELKSLQRLRSIFIDSGALESLEKLQIMSIPQLKSVPSGIQHLKKLQVLEILYMSTEFQRRIDPNGGEDYFMIKHVPHLHFVTKNPALLLAERAANIFSDSVKKVKMSNTQ